MTGKDKSEQVMFGINQQWTGTAFCLSATYVVDICRQKVPKAVNLQHVCMRLCYICNSDEHGFKWQAPIMTARRMVVAAPIPLVVHLCLGRCYYL